MTPFEALVRDMRKAQQEHARICSVVTHNERTRLEALVDRELEAIRKADAKKRGREGENLFEKMRPK